ncbi:MAG: YbaB/EbfC family nucleoid-associated protein [Chitinispirillaceae bacterium]|nr:YbaB/EbfC family nucleoid-associated protein [Chitinispirillaceae bacterium]
MSQINKLLKQAKTMQSQVMKMQGELQKKEFEGIAGGGMVRVVLNGAHGLVSVKINPEVVNSQDVEMLEDLVSAAHASALESLNKASESAYGSFTGGLSMPGL